MPSSEEHSPTIELRIAMWKWSLVFISPEKYNSLEVSDQYESLVFISQEKYNSLEVCNQYEKILSM